MILMNPGDVPHISYGRDSFAIKEAWLGHMLLLYGSMPGIELGGHVPLNTDNSYASEPIQPALLPPPPLAIPPPWGVNGHLAQKAQKILCAEGAKEKFYKAPKLIYTVIL